MKIKIKKIIYSLALFLVLAPITVIAAPAATSGYVKPANTGLPAGSLFNIVNAIMGWLLGLVGIVGVIGFAIAGILYLTAAGDEDRIAQAKRAMTWSIVGVIVALMGVVMLGAAASLLGANKDF